MSKKTRFTYARDANAVVLNDPTNFQSQDATATPVKSPVSVTSGAEVVLTHPTDAIAISITPTYDIYVSQTTGVSTAAGNTLIPAGVTMTLPISGVKHIYLIASSTTASVVFLYFTTTVIE
jgi:hypothetical protein